MALKECPDCGRKVSDRANTCPNCGCPAEFFVEIEEKPEVINEERENQQAEQRTPMQSDEKVVFQFAGQRFEYFKKEESYVRILGRYLMMAETIKYMSELSYDRQGSIENVLGNFPVTMEKFMQESVYSYTIECLYRLGNSMSIEQLIRKYEGRYKMQYDEYCLPIVEKYAEIRHEESRLAEYRSAVKASRSRWSGGGFGIKGAVKGAVQAGMLNLGSDFLHSFGDAAAERHDDQEIQTKLENLYRDPETKAYLTGRTSYCVWSVMYALQDEIESMGLISTEINIEPAKAATLFLNTLKFERDGASINKNLAQCISLYPTNPMFYEAIEPWIGEYEEKDICGFIDFWGFHDYLSSFSALMDNNFKNDIDNWELKSTFDTIYEKYKSYRPPEVLKREAERIEAERIEAERRRHEYAEKLPLMRKRIETVSGMLDNSGISTTIGLRMDGTVVAVGHNEDGQCDVGGWTDIVSVTGANSHTVGLRSDGTVVAVGANKDGRCDVGGWTDIVSVAAGGGIFTDHTVGLRSDGTVVAVGKNKYGRCDVSGWTNIVSVAVGIDHTVGLRSDGTVVAVGKNKDGRCDVGGWTDIVSVTVGGSFISDHTVGLRSDGTVVAVGENYYGQCDVDGWTDIVSVAAGSSYTVGLRSDGTVVAVGHNEDGQCNVGGWTNIVSVAVGIAHTVGLRLDGTVVAVGKYEDGQCDVDGWTDIVSVAGANYHTVGLRSDGTVVAVGKNDYGQCDVDGWKLFDNIDTLIEDREKAMKERKPKIKPEQQQEQSGASTVFCVYCGKRIERGAKFCNFCGKPNTYQ